MVRDVKILVRLPKPTLMPHPCLNNAFIHGVCCCKGEPLTNDQLCITDNWF